MPTLAQTFLHPANIALHVATGLIVLLLGLFQLQQPKGGSAHVRRGRMILRLAWLSVMAAALGAIVFRPHPDLLAVVALVAYQLYSGERSLRLARNGRGLADWLPAAALGLMALVMLNFGDDYHWEPTRVRAVGGSMLFMASYDLLRTRFPASWRRMLNPAEHAWRLTGMIGAMASVAAAQQLPVPLAVQVSLAVSIGFALLAVAMARRAARNALGVQPSADLNARLNADREL